MNPRIVAFLVLNGFFASSLLRAADDLAAPTAVNQIGLELLGQISKPDENVCLSPYSIQSALAMTFAGAEGDTRSEMARVLHFNDDTNASFAALQKSLQDMVNKTIDVATEAKKFGGPSEPITLAVANRLFPQKGYRIRDQFMATVQQFFGGNPEPLDFHGNPEAARQTINHWVAEQTHDRIQDLIPPNGLNKTIRMVLANALYLKAPWAREFDDALTKPAPFHVRGGDPVEVPTMRQVSDMQYLKQDGFTAIALPYLGGELQFVVLVPDKMDGLAGLEKSVDWHKLADLRQAKATRVDLSLPKFKFTSPTIPLGNYLQALGMKSAFDQPPGSANFDRMAPRTPNDYLAISEVFHKTFIAVDEKGTEAAAATAVAMMAASARMRQPEPVVVKVDHPFLFAIQHVSSGACLFLGHVTDPR